MGMRFLVVLAVAYLFIYGGIANPEERSASDEEGKISDAVLSHPNVELVLYVTPSQNVSSEGLSDPGR